MKQRWGVPLLGLTARESSDLVVPVLCPTWEAFPTSSEVVHHAKAITEVSLELKLLMSWLCSIRKPYFFLGWFPLEQHHAGSLTASFVCSGSISKVSRPSWFYSARVVSLHHVWPRRWCPVASAWGNRNKSRRPALGPMGTPGCCQSNQKMWQHQAPMHRRYSSLAKRDGKWW